VSLSPISEVELTAYVDGEIVPDRRAAIEAYLAAHPAEAARVETWRRQNEIIRAAFGRALADAAPLHRQQAAGEPVVRLEPVRAPAAPAAEIGEAPIHQAQVPIAPRRDRRLAAITVTSFLAGVASALIVVAAFGLTPVFLNGLETLTGKPMETTVVTDFGPALAARALEAHQTYGAEPPDKGVRPLDLKEQLSLRLGLTVPVPDLTAQGLRLVQGRLAPADIGPAAFLVYEGPQGERIGFMVTRAPGEDRLRFAQGRSASVAIWTQGGTGFAVTGSADRQRLLTIAETAMAGLKPR
jgi:anti-sigma factor RsiW